jgi:hypothetical protein
VSDDPHREEIDMGGTAAAGIALAAATVLLWKNRLPRIASLLMLVAGAGITDGIIGRYMHNGVDWGSHLVGQLTSRAIGVAVPAVLAVVLAMVFVHDMWPKHRATRITAAVAFVLPVLIAGLPGLAGSVLGSAVDTLRSVTVNALGSIFGGA